MDSEAQKTSRKRNWNIKRLRGAWSLFHDIGSNEGMIVVDNALKALGAETEADRIERQMKEKRKYFKEAS